MDGSFMRRAFLSSILLSAVLAGCGGDTALKSKDEPAYQGVTLRLCIEKGSPLSEALRIRVPEWEARTGAKVETAEAETIDPGADVAACSGTTLAGLPHRRPLSSEFKRRTEVQFINVPYLQQTAFGARRGAAIGIPLTVEQFLLWRRADLFNDDKLKAAYKQEFMKDLAPPTTWEDYARVAAFFQKSNAVKFGCAEAFGDDADGLRGLFARAASYSEDPRSTPLDVADARSRLADPDFQKAAENLLASLKSSPAAGGASVSLKQARRIFAAGDAAMILVPLPPTSDPSFKVAPGFTDKLGVSALPTSAEVFSPKSKTWRPRQLKGEEVPPAPYFAATGHYLCISETTKNPVAAENLVAFLADARESAYLVQGARLGLTPSREDMLSDSGRFSGGYGLPGKLTADYFSLVRDNLRPSRWATDLRVPNVDAFLKPLGEQLRAAAAGKVSLPAALEKAHQTWRKEIERRGDEFIDDYRMGQGFSPRIK
jgi:multiple sugar transport system substrate-binding protein